MQTIPIHKIWRGGDLFDVVIVEDDGVWMKYVPLGARDVRGAWITHPTPRNGLSANNRGLVHRSEAYRKANAKTLAYAAELLGQA